MLNVHAVLTLVAAVCVGGFGLQPAGIAAAAAQAEPEAKSPADAAFEPIARDLKNIFNSLRSAGGISPADQEFIRALRDRAAAFSKEFPDDIRGPAAELQLSRWLQDNDVIDGLYARMIEMAPDNSRIRGAYGTKLAQENRYAEALQIFSVKAPDPVEEAAEALVMAECLFAEHRVQEAFDAVSAIPADAFMEVADKRSRQEQLKKNAQEYVALWPQEQAIRSKEEATDDLPRAIIVTSRGSITVELFENESPNTVANFISLAEQGFYNTTKFHRVLPNFMAQGGDKNSKPGETGIPGEGDPGYFIPDEVNREDHRKHFSGSLAMAKTEAPNTAGSQFYVTVTPTPWLNGRHTVFGRVIDGLDVARGLKQDDVIELVTVTRKRDHEYKPNTLPVMSAAAAPPPGKTVDPAAAAADTLEAELQRPETAPEAPQTQPGEGDSPTTEPAPAEPVAPPTPPGR